MPPCTEKRLLVVGGGDTGDGVEYNEFHYIDALEASNEGSNASWTRMGDFPTAFSLGGAMEHEGDIVVCEIYDCYRYGEIAWPNGWSF